MVSVISIARHLSSLYSFSEEDNWTIKYLSDIHKITHLSLPIIFQQINGRIQTPFVEKLIHNFHLLKCSR